MYSSVKNTIEKSFNKAIATYDANSNLQKTSAEILISMLQSYQNTFNTIADFACGTGISTQLLLTRLHHHKIYGIDFSEKLLQGAQNKINKNVTFIRADFDEIIFQEQYIDLAFCNMGLQWSLDLKWTLIQIQKQLNDLGIFAFCLPVAGTFSELNTEYCNNFYSLEIILAYLAELEFDVIDFKERIMVYQFESALSALKSIKSIGANVTCKNNKKHKGLVSQQMLSQMFVSPNEIALTYKLAFFICRKKV